MAYLQKKQLREHVLWGEGSTRGGDKGFESGFRVEGLGFRVSGFGFRVSGLGFRV